MLSKECLVTTCTHIQLLSGQGWKGYMNPVRLTGHVVTEGIILKPGTLTCPRTCQNALHAFTTHVLQQK